MDNNFFAPLSGTEIFKGILNAIAPAKNLAVYDLCEGQRAFLAAAVAHETGKIILCLAPAEQTAQRLADDMGQLLGESVEYLPAGDTQFIRAAQSRETDWQRLKVLTRLCKGKTRVICAPAEALLCRQTPRERFMNAVSTVKSGDVILPLALVERLVKNGYERVDMVEGKGQCALRGAILDVYPPDGDSAVRIEFFDDEVDSLRSFDCISQRSLENLDEVLLAPATEWLLRDGDSEKAAARMRAAVEKVKKTADIAPELPPLPDEEDARATVLEAGTGKMLDDCDRIAQGAQILSMGLWTNVLLQDTVSLLDWLPDDAIIILDTPERVKTRCEDRNAGFHEDFKLALDRGEAVPAQGELLLTFDDVLPAMQRRALMTMQDFLRGMSGLSPTAVIKAQGMDTAKYQGRMKELAADVLSWQKEHYAVALLAGGDARSHRLQAALAEQDVFLSVYENGTPLENGKAVILPAALSHGFVWQDAKICVIADSDIYGAGYKKTRARRTSGEKIEAFTDLKEGDYVVHDAHGIGIFRGTVRLQSEGTYRDYLYIRYQGNDKLYVPIDQFDRVQKYIGSQETPPPLNDLGGGDWQKKKARVKAGLKQLAFNLVKLYADRASTPGHPFAKDTPWTQEFNDHFPYELTPDQRTAVEDIARDMEKPLNMDRLVCGDVGYGKTEVAMRAAFKAVMDGKQVALLAPTTILAQQHYYTLKKRFEGFPVTIDVVSRFRTPKNMRETLNNVSLGKVDILVGTHRILSKDVKFKDLGLLIVDEEQRFGVAHKEIIKNMKKTVDVLTLSATPIPRTLHMSMVGVRDMSLLTTPPEERSPVQTYVMDYSDSIIRDAIMRELAREGQVYFLYNRVASIDMFCARLKALVPEARIGVGHGQMKEHALEDVMMDFYAGKYDVLLCSTIIENGLDVPRANTIIVYDADRFGLSQLYQLRGRVGRSNRSAYAYFTVRPDKMLSETAEKRLSAIREFTEFGSGFRIAMRDLEIRGAGNIFGPEQSGHVSTVGYDMYCKLIEEAVREAQGDMNAEQLAEIDTRVDLRVDAFLPVEYVRGENQRMEVYKRISLIRDREDREDVIEELIDRFGEPPVPVMTLIDIAHLRALCGQVCVKHVTYQSGALVMKFDPSFRLDPMKLYAAMEKTDKRLLLSAGKDPALMLRDRTLDPDAMLKSAVPMMEKLLQNMAEK